MMLGGIRGSHPVRGLAFRYAGLAFLTHALFITLSLVPGWGAIPLLSQDAITYVEPARNLLDHGAFSREQAPPYLWEPQRTPAYPLLIAATLAIFHDLRWVLYLSAFSAGVAGWCAVRLAAEWGGGIPAQHLAGALLALLPNSLGLAGMVMTDAIFGHIFLLWFYLTWMAFRRASAPAFAGCLAALWFLEGMKPTFNAAALLVVWFALVLDRRPRRWVALGLLCLLTLPLPLYFAWRNHQDNGVFTPTLLGVATLREYLQVRSLAETSGADVFSMTQEVRARDHAAAARLSSPPSPYGRLYRIKQAEVRKFLAAHPWRAARLSLKEAAKQFFAPQEFVFHLFLNDPPAWLRALGSLLTLSLWAAAARGAWLLGRQGEMRPTLVAAGALAFFLGSASISHAVGGRLRFPGDLAVIPLAAISAGLSASRSLCPDPGTRE